VVSYYSALQYTFIGLYFELVMFFTRFTDCSNANCAEIHRCLGLEFSYIEETDGDADFKFTAYIHSD